MLENPPAQLLSEAQTILLRGDAFLGPSKADTIKALKELLCSPVANQTLLHADTHAEKKVAEARAAFVPALERAAGKLAQLRPNYTGSMGMSIDRDLLEIRTARDVARDGLK